jgi:orotate phosphoribosyltransferase
MITETMVAEKLLEIKAVSLNPNEPFVWTSGIKSPIYCDNRLILGYPELRKEVAKGLTGLIESHFPEVELIAGTATAGIPHAAWVSDLLSLPMCYVRSSSKGHGKKNQIEGPVQTGQKVVVIEDLISTGKSSIQVANVLKEAGCRVLGIVSIFTYQLIEAEEACREANVPYYSLSNFSTLIDTAVKKGYLTEDNVAFVMKWRENPKEWGISTCYRLTKNVEHD